MPDTRTSTGCWSVSQHITLSLLHTITHPFHHQLTSSLHHQLTLSPHTFTFLHVGLSRIEICRIPLRAGSYVLREHMNICCVYEAHMTPPLTETWCYWCCALNTQRNFFNFYLGQPHLTFCTILVSFYLLCLQRWWM